MSLIDKVIQKAWPCKWVSLYLTPKQFFLKDTLHSSMDQTVREDVHVPADREATASL